METIMNVNSAINSFVWGPVMLIFIVGVGVYFSFRLGFLQVVKFGTWNKLTLGKLFKARKAGAGSVTPFQAFSTAMAATAGVGNLVGVSTSIIIGGPGAIFWMMVSGFFGMITKFAEITLAIHFRKRNAKGEWVGGPMYYISEGLGKNFRWLAIAFCIFGAICAFGIGNMTQINAAVGTMQSALVDLNIMSSVKDGYSHFNLILGIVLAAMVGLVILGGFKRIGETAEKLVPFAGIFCIIGSIVAIIMKADMFGTAIMLIVKCAFSSQAIVGGVLGYAVMAAIRFGIARGVFTNEAGMGSAPIAHAAADVDHPTEQAVWGCFEVFADTLIMCLLTALVVLTSGVYTSDPVFWKEGLGTGSMLVSQAFKASFGVFGSIFMALCVLIFAYCTALSWSLYGLRCFQYLTKDRGTKIYLFAFCVIVVVAAIMQLTLAWDIADTLNGLMAIPNLIGLIGLSGLVIKITKDYFSGENKFKCGN